MKERLKKMLRPKRFSHSINVSKEAKKMAARFGADTQKAYIAGLLHDCAKDIPQEKLLKICQEHGVGVSWIEKNNPALIHAPLGAKLAQELFDIQDPDVLNAIAYHTVGRAGMSVLEKIIYVADMIEPARDFPGVEQLRLEAQKDLDSAALLCIQSTVECNLKRQCLIHPGTVEMWNDLIAIKKNHTV